LERRTGEIGREVERIVDAIATGAAGPAVAKLTERINALEVERAKIALKLQRTRKATNMVALHPKAIEAYKSDLANLGTLLTSTGGPKRRTKLSDG
jgi:hypothetical protein